MKIDQRSSYFSRPQRELAANYYSSVDSSSSFPGRPPSGAFGAPVRSVAGQFWQWGGSVPFIFAREKKIFLQIIS